MRTEREIQKWVRDLYIEIVALKKRIKSKDGDLQTDMRGLRGRESILHALRWVLENTDENEMGNHS